MHACLRLALIPFTQRILQVINSLTVAQIKSLMKSLNTALGCGLRQSGNKPGLLQRLEELVTATFHARDAVKYDTIRVTLGEELYRYQSGERPEWARR